MNVWLNADGTRDREFRPYIEQEETARSVYLYNPEGPGFKYGLYNTAQPTCGGWIDIYNQYPSHVPAEIADSTGRLHKVRPDYWRHGYKATPNHYERLIRHTRPS